MIEAGNRRAIMHSERRNLVLVRAGDNSLHPHWLAGDGERNWDIVVNYYGDDPERFRQPDVVRIDSKGPKWPALQALLTENPDFLNRYDYIWLPDDDLMARQPDINRLFDICRRYTLGVAQPALSWDSYYSHLLTLRNEKYELRFTNYVEIMAPCFAAEVLRKTVPLLNCSLSGWGLDFVWPKLVQRPRHDIAIIDAVAVRHTRPIGGPNYKMLREIGASPWDELRNFCRQHGLDDEPAIVTHHAVLRNGKTIDAEAHPLQFNLGFIPGYLPALSAALFKRRLLRGIIRMTLQALLDTPHRVSETSTARRNFRLR
jgi:Protein of unknown function (DUF707)